MMHHLLQKLIQPFLDNSLNYVFTIKPTANRTKSFNPHRYIVNFKFNFFCCCQLVKKLMQALIEQYLNDLLDMLTTHSVTICPIDPASFALLPEIIYVL